MTTPTYPFEPPLYRAQCLNVVDGDTVDLLVDCGFHNYRIERFRLLGIDAPELNSKDPVLREQATTATNQLIAWLGENATMSRDVWPLRIRTNKSDSFGRWLAEIWCLLPDGSEVNVNNELLSKGLAVSYVR